MPSITSEINKLWGSSFFYNCLEFDIDFRSGGKNWKKKCVFKKIAFEFISLNTNFAEREYLSLGVNMLTNSLKIWDTTKKKLLELKFF